MTTLEKSGENVRSKQSRYIILSKRKRTKLVLDPDSAPEFDGWLKTLTAVTEQLKEIKPEELESEDVVETESSDKPEVARGRSRNRGWGKAPVPTPRNKTPSREGTSSKDQAESSDMETQKVTNFLLI